MAGGWVNPLIAAAKRAARAVRINTRLTDYTDAVFKNVNLTVAQKLRMAAQVTRDATVYNVSRPVTKVRSFHWFTDPVTGVRKRVTTTRVVESSRSKQGEFPKADTTRLMKDIFWEFDAKTLTARIGTTLDYGLYLETRLKRSFLRRTLQQMMPWIALIFKEGATQADKDAAISAASVEPEPAPKFI